VLIAERVEQIAKTRAVTTQMGFGLGSRIKAGQFDIEGSGIEHDDLPACGGGNGSGLPESLASCSVHRGRYFLSGRFLSVVFKGWSQVLVKRILVVLPEREGKSAGRVIFLFILGVLGHPNFDGLTWRLRPIQVRT
jgi:hypothetical protein